MDNYSTILFQSSSSAPQNSDSFRLNTMNSHAQNHEFFQDHEPGNGYIGLITSMENNIPKNSTTAVEGNNPVIETENEAKSAKRKRETKSKKPKFAFQTRSQVDILDDGYRWRKYGQKAVKNNKFPRSYYRCTYQGCNVKKQVQRLSKDEGVVVTTYEGMHSHSIEKSTDNFEHILSQMQIYTSS
ncbi:hypothetical protein BUALT_Bualt17G0015800 [Buddleja alternifolia]|uniref:WRKY domain-containing protein n=1 Tax=Buddleja alternifolia TaxID=168488 RepID=A0AAV6WG05_9LAMI|nr:hypothetical protein BUALT_Bualt17G0015800 [Buddleja alternifolia]